MSLMAALLLAGGAFSALSAEAPAPVGPADGRAAAPPGWVTVMAEGFENTWPNKGWTVTDVSNDPFQRYWGKDDFKPHSGTWSVWPASGGTHAVDPATNHYPDNMNTRMIYGPFDLSDALDAEISFWMWLETEVYEEQDYLYFGHSGDGANFSFGGLWEGTLDWSEIVVDLTPYAGDSSVWIRWDFHSDGSVGLDGAFVDDVTVSKLPLTPPAAAISLSQGKAKLDWPAIADATGYEVWWGVDAPYFTPGSNCAASTSCAVVAANTFLHSSGGAGNTDDNYSYVVRSVKGSIRSQPSNRIGEFDFRLVR